MAVAAFSPAAFGSGSIGAGAGKINQYGTLYKQGKSAFFRKIACNRAHCPLKRRDVNGEVARNLVDSLAGRAAIKLEASDYDQIINQLCPGEEAARCRGKVDEQEAVQHYLSVRFGLS